MNKEEKEVLKTFKNGLGLTSAEREILTNYIDKLQKENEELKEDNQKQWEERCRLTFKLDDYISKDRIRNKIKDYESFKELARGSWDITTDYDSILKVLQELPEEE